MNNNNGKDAAGSQVHVCPFEQCTKEIFRKDPSSGFSVGRSIDSILSEIDQK
jgi:hypothetical protein